MTLKINGATGGSVSIDAPDNTSPSGTDVTLTLPTSAGSSGQVLTTDGSGTLSFTTLASDSISEGNTTVECVDTGSDGHITFDTEGTERLRIESNGDVLSKPNNYFNIQSTTTGVSLRLQTTNTGTAVTDGCLLQMAGDNNVYFYNKETNTDIRFGTNDTERMRLDGNGYLTLYKNTSSNESRFQFHGASTRIAYNDSSGHLTFYTNSAARVRCNYLGGFLPVTDNSMTLGTTTERWSVVYAALGTIQTSDLREKTDIATSSLGTDFIKQLRPVSYKFKVGQNDVTVDEETGEEVVTPRPGIRTHWGFVAQEVKEAVDAAGVDFGGWILTDKDDPDSSQGLRYDQFIAPLTKALQEAIAKIETLETANASQAATIAALDARLTALEGGAA